MRLARVLVVMVCLLASTCFFVKPAQAEKAETSIRVVVVNDYGKPVENAAVILDFLGGHSASRFGMKKPIHWEVHTNQEGKAHFPPIPEGKIQLQVITKRYQTYGEKLDIAGDEKEFDITLHQPQSQYSAHPPLKPAQPKQ